MGHQPSMETAPFGRIHSVSGRLVAALFTIFTFSCGFMVMGGLDQLQVAAHFQQSSTSAGSVATAFPDLSGITHRDFVSVLDEGEKTYLSKCARCHGREGEGTAEFSEPLIGDLPVDELTEYIEATMPEDKPEDCVGEEAKWVAQYIHQNFYNSAKSSPENLQRKFSRLTTRQFKESLTDLVSFFESSPWHPPERGLQAVYYGSRHPNEKRQLADRTDRNIDFPVGVPFFDPSGEYPKLEKIKAENQMGEGFSVYWSGSILAPQTGWYTFKVESKNGFQLFINNRQEPLIDRKVRSDDVVEHSARLFLQTGRAYSLKLDFFSYPDPPAKIRLLWKTPLGIDEVIPHQYFFPQRVPETFAASVDFPADDASSGYERGISISQEWDAAVTASAIELADWVADRVFKYAETDHQAGDREIKVKTFCRRFVELAFTKPLTDEESRFFIDQHFDNDFPLKDQVKRVVILAIKSPRFLYPESEQRNSDFAIARQLALVVWDSLPDRKLWDLAQRNELTKPEILEGELDRMLSDPRAKAKLSIFFSEWLNLDKKMMAQRDSEKFDNFNPQLLLDSRRSLEKFIEQLIASEHADARQLYTAEHVFANRRLAEFYGWQWPTPNPQPSVEKKTTDIANQPETHSQHEPESGKKASEVSEPRAPVEDADEFILIVPQSGMHAGIVTHPYLMTGLAYYQHSSPIHRGVFVARKLLGRTLKQPNENFEPLTEDFDPTMTNRQRVEFQTRDKTCMACHSVINPLGFSLENFDAVGRYRTVEKEKPVDTTANYKTPLGNTVPLNNALDLAKFLAEDEAAKRNFVRQFFQLYVRQPVEAYGPDKLDHLYKEFEQGQYNLRHLVMTVAKTTLHANTPESESAKLSNEK